MTNARRATLIASVCLTAAVAACVFPGSANAQYAPDTVTIAPAAEIAPDGTLTLSGTYRCSSLRSGPVLIGAKALQGDARAEIDGARAVCDDRTHTWREQALPDGTFRPGAARGEAALVHLDNSQGFVPFPVVLNADKAPLTLRRG
ncbi:DUF6299 family protein [Streptomyces clavuligerus]|nr:DUF6299 family protein [Streptomyces clavuligerus]MBY6306281.1 hypothetical protein [Streptomyces clavuligerus]QCS08918.1 hypothetical protein CRV15_26895 [Streptomyces clavuligerus]QPJ91746.1 hypothetical protein GE265_01260 [Streptomyces clavuligerus]QPL66123.1 hypothetical protein I3J04_26835 [Streptomyces clavuligerus]QPL96212.1 hypothetical protein I3J15_26755 [Streptomyces clavuligerus]